MKKKASTKAAADTLYYDGACPICRSEIQQLQSHADDRLELVDIRQCQSLPLAKASLLNELHLQKGSGEWVRGYQANLQAWQHTPYRHFATLLSWPIVRFLPAVGYRLWLYWYRRSKAKPTTSLKN